MKKIKNYITAELAKKKIARYKYWNIKDESGISITCSEDELGGQSFGDILDKIITDNVDAEVQVKFGTNEQSSRQNTPLFIRINETIEWVEPEEEDTVQINGVPHKVDKNGNVNINFTTAETPVIETPDYFKQELEIQLEGLRKESALKEQRFQAELHHKLAEQTLKFKEMMLTDRESKITQREQLLAEQENALEEKQQQMSQQLKGYVKLIPSTLAGVINDWITTKTTPLSGTQKQSSQKKEVQRNQVAFSFIEEEDQDTTDQPITDIQTQETQEEQQTPESNQQTLTIDEDL